MRPITAEELVRRDLLFRLPFVPDEMIEQAKEAGHFRRNHDVIQLFGYDQIRWLPEGSAWIEPGSDGLYLIRANGTGVTRLVEGQVYYHDLSPDGRTVAYAEGGTIYSITIDGSNQRELAQFQISSGPEIHWSPSGDQILVATSLSGFSRHADLYLIDLQGDEEQRIRHVFHTEEEWLLGPRWSPDGLRIEFVLCDQERANVLLSIDKEGSGRQRIAEVIGLNQCIYPGSWSPDHTWLSFTPSFGGLYILDVNTGYYWQILPGYVPVGPMLWLPGS